MYNLFIGVDELGTPASECAAGIEEPTYDGAAVPEDPASNGAAVPEDPASNGAAVPVQEESAVPVQEESAVPVQGESTSNFTAEPAETVVAWLANDTFTQACTGPSGTLHANAVDAAVPNNSVTTCTFFICLPFPRIQLFGKDEVEALAESIDFGFFVVIDEVHIYSLFV